MQYPYPKTRKPTLYSITTPAGLRYYLEADTQAQAERRAADPAILRALYAQLSQALQGPYTVQAHKGPEHTTGTRPIFRIRDFAPD